jgi:hypothetical protein
MRLAASTILPFVAWLGISASGQTALIDVPVELGPIDWSRTPVSVIAESPTGQAVVWLGRVESSSVKTENGRVVFEWLCRHLTFAERNEKAIAKQPISHSSSKSGYFVVNVVSDIPADMAKSVTPEIAHAGKYILAAGRAEAIVKRRGKPAVFVNTFKMLQANEIAEPVRK